LCAITAPKSASSIFRLCLKKPTEPLVQISSDLRVLPQRQRFLCNTNNYF
jgi:hypothetical protein